MNDIAVLNAKVQEESVATGLGDKDTVKLARYLSNALADSYVLYLKTQGVHWNVVGPMFLGLHNLTETQYQALALANDDLAERIRALGQIAPASFAEFEELTVLDTSPPHSSSAEMVATLSDDNEAVARRLRKAVLAAQEIDDVYTADLLTRRIGAHEEAAWMLRAVLAG